MWSKNGNCIPSTGEAQNSTPKTYIRRRLEATQAKTSLAPATSLPQVTFRDIKMSSPRVAIVIYSLYGHIATSKFAQAFHFLLSCSWIVVAEAVKAGVLSAGGKAEIFQCVEGSYTNFRTYNQRQF
jgi:hypothetical protein